jgi:hypothetical protein
LVEISPELVLVDPELAKIARLRLAEEAAARDSVASGTREVPRPALSVPVDAPVPAPASVSRVDRVTLVARAAVERITPTLLFISLLVNLFLAGMLLAEKSNAPTLETEPQAMTALPPTNSEKQRPLPPKSEKQRPLPPKSEKQRALPQKGAAERDVLRLAQRRAAAGRAPQLVDATTGLLRNNVQAVCRSGGSTAFLCVVHPPHRPSGEGLYLRYRPRKDGRPAVITWLGYRLSG